MCSIFLMPSNDMPPNERKRALHCDARVWTKLDPCESGTTKKRNHEKAEERGTVTDGREGSIVSGGRGKAEEAAAGQVFGGGKGEGAKSRIIQWKRKVFTGKGGKINAAVSV